MSTINISDLRPTGTELFSDSEGYMNDLGDNEFDSIYGGLFPFALLYSVARLAAQRSSAACASKAAAGAAAVGGAVSGWFTGEK
jgi:hypothetical protein